METAIARLDQLLDAIPKNSNIPEPLDMCPICLEEGETNE